jgi:hypothetical protein
MLLPHLHLNMSDKGAERLQATWRRSVLLVLAITPHNFSEGLVVGVAFGAAAAGLPSATVGGVIALAVGIGMQNFPEGLAVSLPLRREGMSRKKSFFYGQMSGVVVIEELIPEAQSGGNTDLGTLGALCWVCPSWWRLTWRLADIHDQSIGWLKVHTGSQPIVACSVSSQFNSSSAKRAKSSNINFTPVARSGMRTCSLGA